MADFSGDSLPELIRIASERGLGHLIKRIKVRKWMKGKGDDTVTVEEIDFEIARDNPAAVQLSKILRLEQLTQLTMSLGSDEQRQVNFLVTLVKQLHAQAQKEGDPITVEGILDKCIEWEKVYQDKDLRSLKPIVMKRLSDGSFGVGEQEKDGDGGRNAVEG